MSEQVTTMPKRGQSARVKVSRYIADEKDLVSRELAGEVLSVTERAIRLRAHAVVRESRHCLRCGKEIENPVSILVGYGPDCSAKLGIPRPELLTPEQIDSVRADVERNTVVEIWLPLSQTEILEVWGDPAPVDLSDRQVTVEGGTFVIRFDYSPHVVAGVKVIPGRRWDAKRKVWTAPLGQAEKVRSFARAFGFTMDAAARAVIDEQRRALEASRATDARIDLPRFGKTLMPFQRAGVKYALEKQRLIIGDEPGLGKTLQAIATVEARTAYPAVVVVPATLKLNWQREIQAMVPHRRAVVLSGTVENVPHAEFVIINYDILARNLEALRALRPSAVIFDEFHACKNKRAQRTQAAKALASGAAYRLGLTGTAIMNRPIELPSQLDILDRLGAFGGFWAFVQRYCGARQTAFGWDLSGATNLDELNELLRRTCYIRREKRDVLTELPAKRRAVVPMELSDMQTYQRIFAGLATWAAKQVGKPPQSWSENPLARITELKQEVARLKLPAVVAWVRDFLESGEKIILFAHHREIVQALAREFDAPAITGATSNTARQAAVDRFQNDPDCKVIVLNMQAAGVGLTLTAASNVAFVELGWTPALHDQCEDRAHRIGQQNSVTAWYLLGAGTIEEWIAELLDAKRGIVEAALIDGERVTEQRIVHELMAQLAQAA